MPCRSVRLVAWLPFLLVGLYVSGVKAASAQPSVSSSFPRAMAPLSTPTPAWPDDGAVDHPIASTGCGKTSAVTPGTTARETVVVNPATDEGYRTRPYWIHVPRGYDDSQPTALVVVFHGGGGTALGAESSTGWSPFADQHGFLVVYPQGLPHSDLGTGYTTWAATGPLDTVGNGVDDLLYVSDLLGYITPSGSIHEYANASAYNGLNDLTRGPDGALWFTQQDGSIGRLTPSGTITRFLIPTPDSQPDGITVGPGNASWFTEMGSDRIGFITL
jgi:hypothetical protein